MSDFVEVALTDVSRRYGHRSSAVTAVDGVSTTFGTGRRIGVVGESGSGKSTLAKMVVGLEVTSVGDITFNGRQLGQLLSSRSGRMDFRRAVQFIGQDTTSSFDPLRRLSDSVTVPLRRLLGMSPGQARDRMAEVLHDLKLPLELADRMPYEVSGGQRQRFAIARGLVVRPSLLVCDEVVSALDVSVQGAILNLIKDYCRDSGAGLMFVSHGLPATSFVASELVVMYRGKIVEHGATAEIFAAPAHPYTRHLLEAYRGRPGAGLEEEAFDSPPAVRQEVAIPS